MTPRERIIYIGAIAALLAAVLFAQQTNTDIADHLARLSSPPSVNP